MLGIPPASDPKSRYRPSGDHTGSESMLPAVVTSWMMAPVVSRMTTSTRPPSRQSPAAIRSPSGDHRGVDQYLSNRGSTSDRTSPDCRSTSTRPFAPLPD